MQGETTMAKTEFKVEPGKHEIVTTRVFDAPRELLFKIMSDPKLIPNWWGPRRLTSHVEKMDVRPGGMWRFVQSDPAGNQFAFHGVYHDVVAPERVVQTFEFEGVPGHVLLQTMVLEDLGGKTKMIQQDVFQSVEDRDGMMQSGMQSGAEETMDRLAELVAKA